MERSPSDLELSGTPSAGITSFYRTKNDELEAVIEEKEQNFRRLEAQRSELNGRGMKNDSYLIISYSSIYMYLIIIISFLF
jgi:hypothetical protein